MNRRKRKRNYSRQDIQTGTAGMACQDVINEILKQCAASSATPDPFIQTGALVIGLSKLIVQDLETVVLGALGKKKR